MALLGPDGQRINIPPQRPLPKTEEEIVQEIFGIIMRLERAVKETENALLHTCAEINNLNAAGWNVVMDKSLPPGRVSCTMGQRFTAKLPDGLNATGFRVVALGADFETALKTCIDADRMAKAAAAGAPANVGG